MAKLRRSFRLSSSDGYERGQGMIEYALVISFVALIVVGALAVLGTRLTTLYNSAASSIPV